MAVVDLVAEGLTSDEVARRLCLSTNTVNTYLRHVFVKLGVRSRVQLTRMLLSGR
jgi:DNA-binding CsgD family transcriptional regulator